MLPGGGSGRLFAPGSPAPPDSPTQQLWPHVAATAEGKTPGDGHRLVLPRGDRQQTSCLALHLVLKFHNWPAPASNM